MSGTQNYLPAATVAAAQARSNQQALALGCDGVQTKYWWAVQPLTDGTASLVILPGTPFDVTTTTTKVAVPTGLTALEQLALITSTALTTKLPWILGLPTFEARLTAPQLGLLNVSVDPAVSVPWAAAKGKATISLIDPATVAMVTAMVADGILTQAQGVTLLTPVAVQAVPQ